METSSARTTSLGVKRLPPGCEGYGDGCRALTVGRPRWQLPRSDVHGASDAKHRVFELELRRTGRRFGVQKQRILSGVTAGVTQESEGPNSSPAAAFLQSCERAPASR